MRIGQVRAIGLAVALAVVGCGDSEDKSESTGDPFGNAGGDPTPSPGAAGGTESTGTITGSAGSTGSQAGSAGSGAEAGTTGSAGMMDPGMMEPGMKPPMEPGMKPPAEPGMKPPMEPGMMEPGMKPMEPKAACPETMPMDGSTCTGPGRCKYDAFECRCKEAVWSCMEAGAPKPAPDAGTMP